MPVKTIELVLPQLHHHQRELKRNAKRFNVWPCGRRFGKTTLGQDLLSDPRVLNYPTAWFSPSYKDMLEVWREMDRVFHPIMKRRSIQERRLEFITGGVLEFWSLENEDAGRGRKYKRVIVDESGMVVRLKEKWEASIMSTLADYGGDAFFKGTPKGRNGFWHLAQVAKDPHNADEWNFATHTTYDNPHIDKKEIDLLKRTMPERTFRQEIMAEFIEDGGGVFRGVMRAVADDILQDEAIKGHQYIMGVDWGKHNDFTVLTVIDVTLGHVCALDRFNQIDYSFQAQRLQVLARKFGVTQVIAEANSMGDAVIERLQQMGLPVTSFQTTNATKKAAIEGLSLAFERDDIRIPNDAILIGELQAYESERMQSGNIRYNAPGGMHDDMVMSLAIGWSGMGTGLKVLW